jgi:hypothetical protein
VHTLKAHRYAWGTKALQKPGKDLVLSVNGTADPETGRLSFGTESVWRPLVNELGVEIRETENPETCDFGAWSTQRVRLSNRYFSKLEDLAKQVWE